LKLVGNEKGMLVIPVEAGSAYSGSCWTPILIDVEGVYLPPELVFNFAGIHSFKGDA